MILVLQIHHHTYVFCGRNTELGQQKKIVRFILRHPVNYYSMIRKVQSLNTCIVFSSQQFIATYNTKRYSKI